MTNTKFGTTKANTSKAVELNDQQLSNVYGGLKMSDPTMDPIGFTATDDLASVKRQDKEGFLLEVSGIRVPQEIRK